MEQKNAFLVIMNEISTTSVAFLIVAGLLFGIAYTYTHFWAIKNIVFKSPHFKRTIFILTFVRLFVFALALIAVARPNYAGVRIILFFAGFMVGRIGLMFLAKKEIIK